MNVCYEAGTFICPILQIRKLSHRSNLPKITQPLGGRSQFLIQSVQLEFLLNHCTILPFFSFASLYHSLAITNPQLVYKSLFSFFVLRNDESQAPEDPKLSLSASALQVSLIVWNAHPISLKETLQVLPPPENLNFPKLKCSALRPAPRCCASKSRP